MQNNGYHLIHPHLLQPSRWHKSFKTEFMIAAQRISQLTPMEVDILFTMSDLYEANGRITMKDIERITPYEEGVLPYNIASQQSEQITSPGERK